MPRNSDPSEISIVTRFRSRCKIQCPGVRLVAVPNGSRRTQWQINQAIREGMAIGFPDMLCFWSGRGFAAIEFKSSIGQPTIQQEEWLERLNRMGFPAAIARSADEGLEFLRQLGAPFLSAAA